ncbi:MAG: MFS transporter [Gammaproteobacteria bacterium]|nr:MFS transporter [Gammaproteobacteria bacterium]
MREPQSGLPTATNGQTSSDAAPPTALYAWFVVVVLALANAVSFIDRLILSLLVQPIKAELQISDTAFSLLAGAAFAIFYCGMGLLVARWADRHSRKWIITGGITLWCMMTALAGTARSYGQLFLYRIGVGVGEATLSPSAYSMLAGYFPPRRLSLAIGVFSAGVTAGTGIAYLLGGALIGWLVGLGSVELPLLGELAGWRLVMVAVGLLGLPVALLMLLVREPPRAPGFRAARFAEVRRHFLEHWRSYGPVFAGYGTTSITAFSVMTWTPALYQRQYGATIPEAAATIGVVALLGGVLGAFSGGVLADRLEQRGVAQAKLRVLCGCGLGLLLPSVIAPLMPTMYGHAALIFFTFFFGSAATGPAGAYVQQITPDRMRAQFGAAYQLSLALVGATVGPFAVGFITDQVFGDEQRLGLSMAIVSGVANPIAAWLLWRALRAARERP